VVPHFCAVSGYESRTKSHEVAWGPWVKFEWLWSGSTRFLVEFAVYLADTRPPDIVAIDATLERLIQIGITLYRGVCSEVVRRGMDTSTRPPLHFTPPNVLSF
jgi:hypothetical protein